MSGLRKAKKYDWKDSNLALFGSDLEKNVKKESAEGEAAWENAGTEVGIQIWRIVKFKVTHWPKEDYGKFYNGDSYIVLHTYHKDPESDELSYDVHFWIGKESTQDEYGTAAYKTVELDNFLDGKPVQNREVQGNESELFKNYFPNFSVMRGGANTGFARVQPQDYKPRLIVIEIVGRSKVRQTEKKLKRANLKNDGVFIIDLGLTIYQWNGIEATRREVFKARSVVENIRSERHGKPTVFVLDDQTVEEFNPKLAEIIKDENPKKQKEPRPPVEKALFRLSDASGRLEFTKIASGDDVSQSQLNTKDVFILETEGRCFAWCGAKASIDERRKSMEYAHKYLMKSENPLAGITCVKEGEEPDAFFKAFD
ncbi:gelsolin-like protein 1 [Actinia tenebrosa]|uniref:Gelsolin-like protein 1 n=1 Tax=Actinia tenebrosa TaxID=6105 RepID=A0A6P8IE69_ACTTE|nr:gelsolin-like protein 1 [Actinia tenebrosa]